jgi:high-affinity iron transporter
LITGVLGIPADPRRIEVVGWFAYLIPVALFVYWPASRRLRGWPVARFEAGIAAVLGIAAILLAVLYPQPRPQAPGTAPLTGPASAAVIGTAQLTTSSQDLALTHALTGSPATVIQLPASQGRPEQYNGISATGWTVTGSVSAASTPATLSLAQLTALSGGRLPVGLNPQEHPGPFTASWSIHRATSVWTADGVLLDAAQQTTAVASVSGSGLTTPRTLSVGNLAAIGLSGDWQVSAAYQARAAAAISQLTNARTERTLWAVAIPVVLAIAALLVALASARNARRLRRAEQAEQPAPALTSAPKSAVAPTELS